MKLNKIFALLTIVGFGYITAGCSKWLDYTPKDKQTYNQQFETKAGFHNAINGIYTNLSSSSLYGYNMSYGSIDYMALLYNIPSGNSSRSELMTTSWTGSYASSTLASIWSSAYTTILNANLVIGAADEYRKSVLSDNEYNLIKGEMLGVRAFLHFDLLRLFGPVYSMDSQRKSIPYNDGIEASRRELLPADELIDTKLLPDLENSESLLKSSDPIIAEGVLNSDGGEKGNWERYRQIRMNYYAVILLKARVYLWKGDHEKALVEAKKLTDDNKVKEHFPFVNPTKLLANSINPDRIFSTECLFGYYSNSLSDIFKNMFSGSLDNNGLLQPRKGYIDILFPNTADYRRQSQWSGSSAMSGGDYDFVKYKGFTANKDNPEFWATFFGLMRISEAYYIAAECLMKQGELIESCTYLNTILKARGASELQAETIKEADLLKEIKKEYLRELRGEGQIYFLFKRMYQSFGMYESGGDPDMNGAENAYFNTPSSSIRYNAPLPSDETN